MCAVFYSQQGRALLLPLNQIWLDPITGLGQWLFLPILASVQQGFRATQTTKPWVFEVARRLTLGNFQSDARQAGSDALALATADTTLLLRAVVEHEEAPASSAGLVHVAAVSSVVTGGAVTTYEDELLDSAEGPNGPGSTAVAMVTQVNTGGNINIDTPARTAPTVVNEQLLRIADVETEVPLSPTKPGAVASNLFEVTAAAAVLTVSTPLDSARDKELVGTGAYADTNPGLLDATDTRALGLPEVPADEVADVLMPHAGLINFVSAIGEGPIAVALTAPVTLDLSGAELFGSAGAEPNCSVQLVDHACVDGQTELLSYCSNSQHQVIQAQAVKDGSILVGANGLPVLVTAAVYSVHPTTLLRLTPTLCISANHPISSGQHWEPAILSPLGLTAPWVRCGSTWNFATQGAQPLLCGDGIHLLATIGHHSWKHEVGISGLSSDGGQRQRALQLNTFVGSTEAAQTLSQELLRQGVQGQALLLPPNLIWLDPSTGLGQWLFLPILASVQQGFRAAQTTKPWILEEARRPTLGNSQSDSRQAGSDALAPATADTTLLHRAVVAHEEAPASSAGLVHDAAVSSAVTGGAVTTYGDVLLDSMCKMFINNRTS